MTRRTALALATVGILLGCGDKSGSADASAEAARGVPQIVDDSNFKKVVLDSKKPVLVDFWATWCGPCKVIAPRVKEIAKDYKGRAVVAKLDVDVAGKTAQQYEVMSIPTLIVFQNGKEIWRVVGVVPKSQLASALDNALKQ